MFYCVGFVISKLHRAPSLSRLGPDPTQPDKDCGLITCGYCNADKVCNANNRCVPKSPQPCEPKTRCDDGIVCGSQVRGCLFVCVFVCVLCAC